MLLQVGVWGWGGWEGGGFTILLEPEWMKGARRLVYIVYKYATTDVFIFLLYTFYFDQDWLV